MTMITPGRLGVAALVGLVRVYQYTLSPFLAMLSGCRFEPSCSQYLIGSLRKHGLIRGTLKGIGRVLRCHPWHEGGYDPP